MNESQSPPIRSWTSDFGQDQFPGIEDSFSGPPAVINPTAIVPAPTATPTKAKGGLPFNLTNLGDLKAMVDRMGGIEGVLSTMGKVQKFMSTMQQIAPMIKLFMGNKGKKSASATKKSPTTRRRKTTRPSAGKGRSKKSGKRR
ncbi:tyrosine protein kinase [Cohnella endophytica]|uniref:Tyrosine protein kinase n=1 Tax=Cohnella endophytica TaxID=2419778 RepID=A0A494XDK9_9BACL|nr:tyrosine protein kinase [Cohnella endophytica]RKP48730.1 tyrosine protein kinase [Cohnella endophytica]